MAKGQLLMMIMGCEVYSLETTSTKTDKKQGNK